MNTKGEPDLEDPFSKRIELKNYHIYFQREKNNKNKQHLLNKFR